MRQVIGVLITFYPYTVRDLDEQQAARRINDLAIAWRSTVRSWPIEIIRHGVQAYALTGRFFPSPGEVIAAAKTDLRNGNAPDEVEKSYWLKQARDWGLCSHCFCRPCICQPEDQDGR
jgi:hypothetical protein